MDIFQTTMSEDPILKHLPKEILEDPFWNQSHVNRPSTFGATKKGLQVEKDDPYRIKSDFGGWVPQDKYCSNNGRLNVESLWGHYKNAPPPGSYNPDHEKLSKRESFPKHSFPTKPRDHYFEQVAYAKKHPLTDMPNNVDPFNPFSIKKSPKKEIKVSELSKINMEDMRKSLLPGPGQYKANYDVAVKYQRSPTPFLKPRKDRVQPRQILDFANMEVVTDRNRKCNKIYDINSEPVLKKAAAYTLGVKRPLLGQREHLSPGPGDYNNEKGFQLGSSTLLSSPVKKR